MAQGFIGGVKAHRSRKTSKRQIRLTQMISVNKCNLLQRRGLLEHVASGLNDDFKSLYRLRMVADGLISRQKCPGRLFATALVAEKMFESCQRLGIGRILPDRLGVILDRFR